MKQALFAAGAMAMIAGSATAGGIDRSRTPYGVLFETGRYVEFGLTRVSPSVSGEYPNDPSPFSPFKGGETGGMANDYTNFSFAYKADVNDKLSYGVFVNTPYGADSSYSKGFYTGLDAEWTSDQLAVILKYKLTDAVSMYGGLRYVSSTANIVIPDQMIRGPIQRGALLGDPRSQAILAASPAGSMEYTAEGERDGAVGYVMGAAWERPDIAARVSLTYESKIEHEFDTTETMSSPALTGLFGKSTTEIELPQSVTLDFQTGVAKDTLVFGSIKWSEWSTWEVRPDGYDALTGDAVTGFEDDVFTYQLGVGRKLNDSFSVFTRVTYEDGSGKESSRLSPVDGQTALGIGGTWRKDGMKVTAGIEYAWLGDTFDGSDVQFEDNTALGFGVTVGYSF